VERPGARHAVRLLHSSAAHFVEIPPGDAVRRMLPGFWLALVPRPAMSCLGSTTERPPVPWRGPGVCGLHRGRVPLRRPRLRSGGPAPPRPSEPVGASNCDKCRHQRALLRRSGDLPAGSGNIASRHARIGPPLWPPGLDCGRGPAIRRLTSNICHNRASAAPARSLRAPARHVPGRLAPQVAPLARRADNVHRHAQRVGHVLEYEIGRADRVSGGAEDGVPGFDRSFTMHPRPSACVQDRPGDTSAATRTLTVTE
jgi:hypothetical protein